MPVQSEKHRLTGYHSLGTWFCYNVYVLQSEYSCRCCHGYTGATCDDIDACSATPCNNGATCQDVPDDPTGKQFICNCPIGKSN